MEIKSRVDKLLSRSALHTNDDDGDDDDDDDDGERL